MKNYHSLLLAKVAVCFLLIAQPSGAVNPTETDLSIDSSLANAEQNLDNKTIDKVSENLELDLEIKNSTLSPLEKNQSSLNVAPKIAQVYNPSIGIPPLNPPVGVPSSPNGVMVPNPEIIIKSNGTPNPDILQPTMPMAPTLPRAVAPPVGDMSISNVNGRYDPIDLELSAKQV